MMIIVINILLDIEDKLLTNIIDYNKTQYTFYSTNNPKKYYYDKEIYGENYFVCLPGKSSSSKQLDNSDYSPNFVVENTSGICCMKKDKHKINSIEDNYNKKPYKIVNEIEYDENDFKLKHLKLGKIPENLYKNIRTFLNIEENKDNKYTNLELVNGHLYRLGILEDENIPNIILSILYIVKYENIYNKLIFINNDKYFNNDRVKKMFSSYLDGLDINDLIIIIMEYIIIYLNIKRI